MEIIKKIKRIYRILFPAKYTAKQIFESILNVNSSIENFQEENGFYKVKFISGPGLFIRSGDSSDIWVFDQIFNKQEYRPIIDLIQLNQRSAKSKIIIDAGANVGYTAIFFLQNLPNLKVFSIEPGAENGEMFLKNTIDFKHGIKLYKNALSEKKNMMYSLHRDFRDGKDWALNTKENKSGEIPGITLNQIIEENKLTHISFLKIDIEGAERFIFKKDGDLSFLNITELLAIEIHDEFHIRKEIYSILRENGFIIMQSGELAIAINSRLF